MRLGDLGVVINHPSQLYRRKVGGDGKASSVARVTNVNKRFLLSFSRHSHVPQCVDAIFTLLPNTRGNLDTNIFQLILEMSHGILGARVVPHDRFTKRLSGLPTPHYGSLALIRNACQSRASKISTTAPLSHAITSILPRTLTLSLAQPAASKDFVPSSIQMSACC
jgi:hypothetical protein